MNNNIKETYVSFKVAMFLKKKGFDVECQYSYGLNGEDFGSTDDNSTISNSNLEYGVTAPTQEVAVEWLRINFTLFHTINCNLPRLGLRYDCYISNTIEDIPLPNELSKYRHLTDLYATPQKALEAGLLYTLKNLI